MHTIKQCNYIEGKYLDLISILESENKRPLHIDEIVEQKVIAFEEEKKTGRRQYYGWLGIYLDSCDSMIYHPNGDIKVVRGSQRLLDLPNNKQRISKDGALILNEDEFEHSLGELVSRSDLKKYRSEAEDMTRVEKVINNPFWNILVPNKNLLTEYVSQAAETTDPEPFMEVKFGNATRDLIKERFMVLYSYEKPYYKIPRFGYDPIFPKRDEREMVEFMSGILSASRNDSNLKNLYSRLIGISK